MEMRDSYPGEDSASDTLSETDLNELLVTLSFEVDTLQEQILNCTVGNLGYTHLTLTGKTPKGGSELFD